MLRAPSYQTRQSVNHGRNPRYKVNLAWATSHICTVNPPQHGKLASHFVHAEHEAQAENDCSFANTISAQLVCLPLLDCYIFYSSGM